MNFIRTLSIFIVTGAAMLILLFPAGFFFLLNLLTLFRLRRPAGFVMYKLAQVWARIVIALTGCSMTVKGRENIPRKGGVCFVANHVGVFDIILAMTYAGRPFGFIAKKELLFIPGINFWILFLGGLFIDRRRPKKALKTINRGAEHIRAGGGMLIFPEGTRSRGRGLGAFHPGALKLATQSEAVIVPLAIAGSYEVFEKHHLVNTVPVFVSFLPPIRPEEFPPKNRKQFLANSIRRRIALELSESSPFPEDHEDRPPSQDRGPEKTAGNR
ncbi:MAG: 1-acyl-sn-glycerol-3-phosphate acyltransferase [Spirochaetaceae bacterium]|jgi:1-acyl-sn-glycerol-3-phosphate acyltransferase|nr:1-acyl-sn-glycerol-3-phosphate acyltransferase [Spirochaetaceae bacterium]